MFHSLTCARTQYWSRHSAGVRIALGIVTSLLLVQTAFNYGEIVYWGVQQGMSVQEMLAAHWPLTIAPLLGGLIGATTQSFLTQRAAQLFVKRWTRWS